MDLRVNHRSSTYINPPSKVKATLLKENKTSKKNKRLYKTEKVMMPSFAINNIYVIITL